MAICSYGCFSVLQNTDCSQKNTVVRIITTGRTSIICFIPELVTKLSSRICVVYTGYNKHSSCYSIVAITVSSLHTTDCTSSEKRVACINVKLNDMSQRHSVPA